MHLFSSESPTLKLNFITHHLTSVVVNFREELKPCHPPVLEVSCILPKVLSFYLCCSPSWSILLVRKHGRFSTSLIPRGVSYTFACSLNLRHKVSPQKGLRGCLLGGDQVPHLLAKGWPIWTQVLTSLRGRTYSQVCWERWVPQWDQQVHWYLMECSPEELGCWVPATRR
jgi:hypothetical protein